MRKNNYVYLFIYMSSWVLLGASSAGRDPTQPPTVSINTPSSTAPQSSALVLNAVFIYPDSKIAIINKQPVKIGDHINEFIVTSISLNTVELMGPSNRREVLELTTPVKSNQPQG